LIGAFHVHELDPGVAHAPTISIYFSVNLDD